MLTIMAGLRPALRRALHDLLARSEPSAGEPFVSLDAVGEALGTLAVTADEIDALLTALEAAGRRIDAPEHPRGEANLAIVLATARALRAELGRPPRAGEIAARAAIPLDDVRNALALARVMQR